MKRTFQSYPQKVQKKWKTLNSFAKNVVKNAILVLSMRKTHGIEGKFDLIFLIKALICAGLVLYAMNCKNVLYKVAFLISCREDNNCKSPGQTPMTGLSPFLGLSDAKRRVQTHNFAK